MRNEFSSYFEQLFRKCFCIFDCINSPQRSDHTHYFHIGSPQHPVRSSCICAWRITISQYTKLPPRKNQRRNFSCRTLHLLWSLFRFTCITCLFRQYLYHFYNRLYNLFLPESRKSVENMRHFITDDFHIKRHPLPVKMSSLLFYSISLYCCAIFNAWSPILSKSVSISERRYRFALTFSFFRRCICFLKYLSRISSVFCSMITAWLSIRSTFSEVTSFRLSSAAIHCAFISLSSSLTVSEKSISHFHIVAIFRKIDSMISDPFQIAYNRIISVDLSRIWHIHLACHKWNDIFGYAFIEKSIYSSLSDTFCEVSHHIEQASQTSRLYFRHHISHSVNFITNLWHCHRAVSDRIGRFKPDGYISGEGLHRLPFAVRKNANRYIRHMCSNGRSSSVVTILKTVWAFAICATGSPGVIAWSMSHTASQDRSRK